MITRSSFIVAVGFAIISCGIKDNSQEEDDISGTYVREYSFKVVNPETGNEIGVRSVRDTIFIRPIETGYEVSNNKWGMNDYDREGWHSMEHAEDRPMPTFEAKLNLEERSLESESKPDLFIDLGKGQLFRDMNRDKPYLKLNK